MAISLIDSFRFLDEDNCEITISNPIVKGVKKTQIVSTQEVLSGILKFAKENKKAEPISIPQFNYFKSPSSPSIIGYDYFSNCNIAMVTVYAPPYDTMFKFKYKGSDSSTTYDLSEHLPGNYTSEKEAKEHLKLGYGHVSSLFKALDKEGIVKSEVYLDRYEAAETWLVPYIKVPWRWPGQIFVFYYKFNPMETNPYANSHCINYACWYLDTDLFHGYENALLYPAYFCNHHLYTSGFMAKPEYSYNQLCLGDNIDRDIRNILRVVANLAYTDNNKDLFNNYDALTMLAIGSRGSLIRKDIIETAMLDKATPVKLSQVMFNLQATGEAFNFGLLNAITHHQFNNSYTGSTSNDSIANNTYKYKDAYPHSYEKIRSIMQRIQDASVAGRIVNKRYSDGISLQILDILKAPYDGVHNGQLVNNRWTTGIPVGHNLKSMLDASKDKLGRLASSSNFSMGG